MYLNFFPQQSYSSQLLIKDLRDQPKNNTKQQCKLKNQSIINEFKKLITRPCHWVQISKKLDGGLVLFQGNLSSFKKLANIFSPRKSFYVPVNSKKKSRNNRIKVLSPSKQRKYWKSGRHFLVELPEGPVEEQKYPFIVPNLPWKHEQS